MRAFTSEMKKLVGSEQRLAILIYSKLMSCFGKKNSEDPYLALLAYRTTPLQNGYSPFQLLMNRRLRSTLPLTTYMLKEVPDLKNLKTNEESYRQKYKVYYNKRHKAVPLTPLKVGDPVWIIDLKRHGTIVQASDNPRSYIIETEGGRTVRRNRFHLKEAPYHSNSGSSCKKETPYNERLNEIPKEKRTLRKPVWLQHYHT